MREAWRSSCAVTTARVAVFWAAAAACLIVLTGLAPARVQAAAPPSLSAAPADQAIASFRAAIAPGPNKPIPFRLFTADSPWNTDISRLPVHHRSAAYLRSMGLDTEVHPDFGTVWNGAPNGIPYVLVRGSQKRVPIGFYYGSESDHGPYPIPRNAPIEGGSRSDGDRHILVVDADRRLLYEVYDAHYNAARGRWSAGSGAVWDLRANSVRPDRWTSADAAGLPMLAGLVRYDEVKAGEIDHALRFTVRETQRAYLYPATHFASDLTDKDLPPMGLRVRLRADYPVSGFPREVQVILRALKKYGMIVADNGGPWYISGAPDPRWDDEALHQITQVSGRDFEVVDTRSIEPAAPVVYAGRRATLRPGGTLRRWGCFADPRGSSWSARVDFGDGGGGKAVAVRDYQRFRLVHRYPRGGTYHVKVWVTDARGATGSYGFNVAVRR
jgi:hypothetical protein